jgi:hypothetical protein
MTVAHPTEGDVKRPVRALLTKHGWHWWMPPANGFGKAGISDTNALKSGVFLAVECKYGDRQPTANQKQFLRNVIVNDGVAFVVRETTVDALRFWLNAFDRAQAKMQRELPVDPADGAIMVNMALVLQKDFMQFRAMEEAAKIIKEAREDLH